MNISPLFSSQKERNEAISMMKGLAETQYWQYLCDKILTPMANDLSDQILDVENKGDMTNLKLQRKYLALLKELPGQVVQSLQDNGLSFFEADPYFKEVKEMNKKLKSIVK